MKIPPYWVERRHHKHGLSQRESEDCSFLGDNNEGPLVRIIRVDVHYGHVGQLKRECTVLTRDIIAYKERFCEARLEEIDIFLTGTQFWVWARKLIFFIFIF